MNPMKQTGGSREGRGMNINPLLTRSGCNQVHQQPVVMGKIARTKEDAARIKSN